MVMRNMQILPAPRVELDLSSFCRFSCLLAIQVTDRDGSINDGSQNHSSFCMLQRAVSMDMVSSGTKSVQLPIGKTTMNVSIHEDNLGALVLAKTLPPQFTPRSKYYAIKTIWFREEIFKRDVQLHKIDTVKQLGDIFTKSLTRFVLNISGRR
jgi:hypothetical protein